MKPELMSILKKKLTESEQIELIEDAEEQISKSVKYYKSEVGKLKAELENTFKAPDLDFKWLKAGFRYVKYAGQGVYLIRKAKISIKSYKIGMYVNTLPKKYRKTLDCYIGAVLGKSGVINKYVLLKRNGDILNTFHTSNEGICLGDMNHVRITIFDADIYERLNEVFTEIIKLLEVANPHSWMLISSRNKLKSTQIYIQKKYDKWCEQNEH